MRYIPQELIDEVIGFCARRRADPKDMRPRFACLSPFQPQARIFSSHPSPKGLPPQQRSSIIWGSNVYLRKFLFPSSQRTLHCTLCPLTSEWYTSKLNTEEVFGEFIMRMYCQAS